MPRAEGGRPRPYTRNRKPCPHDGAQVRVAVVGGTRGIGRALARLLVERGDDVFLLGRDADQLARSAADLAVRGGRVVGTAALDLEQPEGFAAALETADRALGGMDTLVLTAAAF